MEFVTTTRGARSLIYEGYKYVINRRGRDDRIFWRCAETRSCSGGLTSINSEIVSSRANEHSHPPDEAEVTAYKAVDKIKTKTMESIDPVPAIYQQQPAEVSAIQNINQVAAKLPTLYSMESSLYRIRRNRLPQLPKSKDEIHFEGEWTKTYAGEQFLMIEDGEGDDKIIIFSTSVNLRHLSKSKKIYVDGTFQTCPQLFYQIFTLHSMTYGKQFPFAYCLLPGKSRTIYLRAFELIKQKSHELGYIMNPTAFLTDFELAIIQAIELTFPTTEVNGCFFHFTQALNRKISKLGLQIAYREDVSFFRFVRQTIALAFVPVRNVRLVWREVKATAPNLQRVDEFISYFEETWLVGNFPLDLWNVFKMDSNSPRTNNHIEGWHNKLNGSQKSLIPICMK